MLKIERKTLSIAYLSLFLGAGFVLSCDSSDPIYEERNSFVSRAEVLNDQNALGEQNPGAEGSEASQDGEALGADTEGSGGDDGSLNEDGNGDGGTEGTGSESQGFFEPADVSIALVNACGACHEFLKDFEKVQEKSAQMLERIHLPVDDRLFMPTANPSWPESEDGQLVITYLEGLSGEQETEEGFYLADVSPFSEQEAVDYIKSNCSSCHQLGAAYASFWTLSDDFSKDKFSTDLMAPVVFQALYQSTLMDPMENSPRPMPPSADGGTVENNKKVLAWMIKELPLVAQAANERYQNGLKLEEDVVLVYQCEQPITLRQYMNTFVTDMLGRIPTTAELNLFKDELDAPVTADQKSALVAKLNDDITWNVEFINNGLKSFATKFSGADAINIEADTLLADENVVSTLKEEFYQLLKLQFESSSFESIVLSDYVMVNEHTASHYNCPVPPSGDWAACQMPAPRSSFFASLGFLSSKPNSFLQVNNNYGRVARMHYALKGTVFHAATDGPTGDVIASLPDCFKTADYRGELAGETLAPFGAAKIPATGNICQSCHISRLLASGSLLFRPFYKHGQLMTVDDFFNPSLFGADFEADVAEATSESFKNQPAAGDEPQAVNNALLMTLVNIEASTEQACVPGGNADGSDLVLNNLGELADYWMGTEGIELAEGLARHFPRAFSNVDATSDEIVNKVKQAFVAGNGLLMPMIEAYLKSDTYSCTKALD